MKDRVGFVGRVTLVLKGSDNQVKDLREVENTITALGDALVADQMSEMEEDALSHMAVGTGTGGTTTLNNESARVILTSGTQGTGANDNDAIYVATFPAGTGTGALTEAGILNASSNGVLFNIAEFSAINKAAADTLVITWTVTFGAS